MATVLGILAGCGVLLLGFLLFKQRKQRQRTPRPQSAYYNVGAKPTAANPQPQMTRHPGYGHGMGATLGARPVTTTSQPQRPLPSLHQGMRIGTTLERRTTHTQASSRNAQETPRASPYDMFRQSIIPESKPLKDWVHVLGAQRKMAHILDTIEQYSSWSHYRLLMNAGFSNKVETRYQSYAAAVQALSNLSETLELISKYVQFILPTKLVQIGRVAGTPLIKDLDRLQTDIEVEMAGRQMIVEGLDEELLIYGLPYFLLRNNTVRSIWFWKDTARTQCAFMSPDVDFPRIQRNEVVDTWKRARAERNPRPRNEHRNLQRQNRSGSSLPRTDRAASANNNNGNRPSNLAITPVNPSSATTQGMEDLSCPICYEDYNADDSKPLNLVPCGHSVCSMCRPRIHQCPTCRSNITGHSVAFTVLGILEALSKDNTELASLRALKETQERELKELKEREEKLKAELKAAKTTVVEAKAEERQSEQNGQSRDQNNNRNKIYINHLPSEFTINAVIEMLFDGGKDLRKYESGRPEVSLRQEGDHQTCVANFTSTQAAERVISKWNGRVMGNGKNLFVRKFIIANNGQPQNQNNRKKNNGNQRRKKENNQNEPSTSRQGQNGQNQGAGKKNGNSNENAEKITHSEGQRRCLRITKIPHGIDENFIRLLFHGKLIDGVYCEIEMIRGKFSIDFVPATGETSCDGQCIITMKNLEAAKKIQNKFCNWTIPGSNNKLGVAHWP